MRKRKVEEAAEKMKREEENLEKINQVRAGLLLVAIVLVLVTTAALGHWFTSRFCSGTVISGIDCSWLTAEEAAEKIESAEVEIRFIDSKTYTVAGTELGRRIKGISEIKRFFLEQKNGNGIKEFTLSENAYYVDSLVTKEYLEGLPEMKSGDITKSQDAYIKQTDEITVQIVPEIYGNEIDVPKALDDAKRVLKQGGYMIDLEPCIIQPIIKQDDESLVAKAAEINNAVRTKVIYLMSDESTYTLDSEIIGSWIEKDEDGKINFDLESHVEEFVNTLSKKVQELGAYATVTTKNGTFILPVEYGFRNSLDIEAEMAMLLEELRSKGTYERTPCYDRFNNFSNLDNYIEATISLQRLEMYRDGENCFDTPYVPFISGTKGVYDSPTGIYFSNFKASPWEMNKYGYSKVDTWVTVTGNVGFHDASSWRDNSEYTPDRYIHKGSHGCFNLQKKHGRIIYDNILLDETASKGPYGFMPIIIHE